MTRVPTPPPGAQAIAAASTARERDEPFHSVLSDVVVV
uniref:Uncharacterized protein n=1 Tax=Arundo donax TaxID=35708 RepID=A0A0A8XW71_ARUDO